MGLQTFHDKGATLVIVGWFAGAKEKIIISGTPNRLNYFVIFIVYTQLTNKAAARIIQTGGPRVSDPCSKARYKK